MSDSTEFGRQDTIQSQKSVLIPGLPDDIALCCLARVPRKYHSILYSVSRRWRELVCGEELYLYRQKHHLEETWVYALCRDKYQQLHMYVLDPDQLKRGWKRLVGVPDSFSKRYGMGFEVLGKKIYLFGGCCWVEDATDEVYCYDASANTWSKASCLSTARCFFAHEALDGKIYAIGGLGLESSKLRSWEIYDRRVNHWTSHVDPNVIWDVVHSFVLDGKIYVRNASLYASQVHASVYDPSNGAWQHADAGMASGWHGPSVVIDGTLYVLDHTSGLKLMMWQKDIREWIPVRRLSPYIVEPLCQNVAIGKKMVVIGKGLGTMMFDVENAANADGILVSSSVMKLPGDYDVISCRCLSI